MRLISVLIFKWEGDANTKPLLLSNNADLSFVNFFVRSQLKDHVLFHSRLIVERTRFNSRQSVKLEGDLGLCHTFVHPCGLAVAVLTDLEYPQRVAFSLISKVLVAFSDTHGSQWPAVTQDVSLPFPEGEALLKQYQNPLEVDNLLKVQKDLDEVKDVMLRNMDDLLQRGEKLDDLVAKTDDLTKTSRDFYRSAKAQNQCCQYY